MRRVIRGVRWMLWGGHPLPLREAEWRAPRESVALLTTAYLTAWLAFSFIEAWPFWGGPAGSVTAVAGGGMVIHALALWFIWKDHRQSVQASYLSWKLQKRQQNPEVSTGPMRQVGTMFHVPQGMDAQLFQQALLSAQQSMVQAHQQLMARNRPQPLLTAAELRRLSGRP